MTEFLSTSQFAKTVGVSTRTVERWVANGKIQPMRTPGGHSRFTAKDIEDWFKLSEPSVESKNENPSSEKSSSSLKPPSREAYRFIQQALAKRRILGMY